MRNILLILSIVFFYGCNSFKPITISLKNDDNSDIQLGYVTYLLPQDPPDSLQSLIKQRLGLKNFSVFTFEHNPGKINKIGSDKLDSKSLFLIGTRNDSIYIVADENNNNNLEDDRFLVISKKILQSQSLKNLERLPVVYIKNLEANYNNTKILFSKKLYLMPDTIGTKDFHMTAISNERMKGEFKYRKRKYTLMAKQGLSGYFDTTLKFVDVRIDDNKDTVTIQYNRDNILQIFDTVKKGNNIFVLKNISPFLGKIILQPIKVKALAPWVTNIRRAPTVTPIEEIKGQLYPALEYFSDSIAVLKEVGESKVLFVNFWFANCPPCITEFNALNNLYTQFKNNSSFKLVSLTFESPEVIQKMRKKYSLLFDIYSVPKTEIQKLSLNNSFPTNIIIDKKGIVKEFYMGGETEQEKADLFFKNEVMSGILKLLK
jgi:thiol-disulfide isomerase/thioredoxin